MVNLRILLSLQSLLFSMVRVFFKGNPTQSPLKVIHKNAVVGAWQIV